MKKLVYLRETEFNKHLQELNGVLEKTQAMLNEFKNLNLFEICSNEEIMNLINAKATYIKQRLEEELPEQTLGKFRLKRSAAFEMLELPSLDRLIEMCNSCKDFQYNQDKFTLKNGSISLDRNKIDHLREMYSVFTHSEEEEKLAKEYINCVTALNSFQKVLIARGKAVRFDDIFSKLFAVTSSEIKVKQEFFTENFTD